MSIYVDLEIFIVKIIIFVGRLDQEINKHEINFTVNN